MSKSSLRDKRDKEENCSDVFDVPSKLNFIESFLQCKVSGQGVGKSFEVKVVRLHETLEHLLRCPA